MITKFNSMSTNLPDAILVSVIRNPSCHPSQRYTMIVEHPQHGEAKLLLWGESAQQIAGDWNINEHYLKLINEFASRSNNILRDYIDGKEDCSWMKTTKDLYKINRFDVKFNY